MFRQALIDEVPIEFRGHALAIIEMMPHDHDGVWAELADLGANLDYETVVQLCQLFVAAETEQ